MISGVTIVPRAIALYAQPIHFASPIEARNAGKPLSRAAIAEEVWRQTPVDVEETNIVDVYVAYLRKKLDTPSEQPLLQTVRGVGYVLRAS